MYRTVQFAELNRHTRGCEQLTQASTCITLYFRGNQVVARAEFFKELYEIWEPSPKDLKYQICFV